MKLYYIHLISMGCGSSGQTASKPLAVKFFDKPTRDKLRQIIISDDYKRFAELDQQLNIPPEAEISQEGLLWNTLHYCCKNDSPISLDYILRKCFGQRQYFYHELVNSQTKEGFSPLHICCMYGSDKCFYLLVRYGGLDLTLKDKSFKTVVAAATDYKRSDLKNFLNKISEKNLRYITWCPSRLQDRPNILEISQVDFADKQKQIFLKELSKTNKIQELAQQVRLKNEKAKLEEEKQKIRQEIAKKQKQNANQRQIELKNQSSKQQQQLEAAVQKNRQVQESEKRLRDDLARKAAQIEKLKAQMQNFKKQTLAKKIEEQNKKVVKQEKQINGNFQIYRNTIINSNQIQAHTVIPNKNQKGNQNVAKQQIKKKDIPSKSTSVGNINQLPANIKALYEKAKKDGIFNDPQFPATDASIGPAQKINQLQQTVAWLRPAEFFGSNYQLFDGIDPNDIKQGALGDCYCLATIAQLAVDPNFIKGMFPFYDMSLGFYVVKFYTNGKLTYTVVDDMIPCSDQEKEPLFSKPIGNQIWVQLIEKAWSKKLGSYFSAEGMTPDLCMEDLSGSPSYGASFSEKADPTRQIIDECAKNNIIVLTTGQLQVEGIVSGHAYSLQGVYEDNGQNIYKLRNPWGSFEWNGAYGSNSQLWTPALKKKCEFTDNEDDGIFFMSESELLEVFVYYSISLSDLKCKYNYVEFQSNAGQDLYYTFTLTKDSNVCLRLTQLFDRMLNDPDYQYSSVVFELGKIENGKVTYWYQGDDKCAFGDKSVFIDEDIFYQYEKGDYFVHVRVNWVNPAKYNKAVLSIFTNQDVKFKPLSKADGQKLWKTYLISFMEDKQVMTDVEGIQYVLEWMNGQLVCFAYVAPTQKHSSAKIRWDVDPAQVVNLKLGLAKVAENALEFVAGKGRENANVGTMSRPIIADACDFGQMNITATPK